MKHEERLILDSPVLIEVSLTDKKEVVSTITSFTKDLDLQNLQEAVGGYVEIRKSRCGKYDLIINEEGSLRHLHHNQIASSMVDDFLVGNVVVAPVGLME
jgi:hypothetical protein